MMRPLGWGMHGTHRADAVLGKNPHSRPAEKDKLVIVESSQHHNDGKTMLNRHKRPVVAMI
jgi:hypothetical protein